MHFLACDVSLPSVGLQIDKPPKIFFVTLLVPAGKFRYGSSNYTTAAPFHILSNTKVAQKVMPHFFFSFHNKDSDVKIER